MLLSLPYELGLLLTVKGETVREMQGNGWKWKEGTPGNSKEEELQECEEMPGNGKRVQLQNCEEKPEHRKEEQLQKCKETPGNTRLHSAPFLFSRNAKAPTKYLTEHERPGCFFPSINFSSQEVRTWKPG